MNHRFPGDQKILYAAQNKNALAFPVAVPYNKMVSGAVVNVKLALINADEVVG